MENLELRSSTTQIKIIGTMLSISGALIAVLFKGPTILSPSLSSSPDPLLLEPPKTNWVLGGLLLVTQNFLNSLWYIFQVIQNSYKKKENRMLKMGKLLLKLVRMFEQFCVTYYQAQVVKMYPDEPIVTLIYFICKTVIALPICFIADSKLSDWTLGPDIALVTIVISV